MYACGHGYLKQNLDFDYLWDFRLIWSCLLTNFLANEFPKLNEELSKTFFPHWWEGFSMSINLLPALEISMYGWSVTFVTPFMKQLCM